MGECKQVLNRGEKRAKRTKGFKINYRFMASSHFVLFHYRNLFDTGSFLSA
jgi:hypothetical protein